MGAANEVDPAVVWHLSARMASDAVRRVSQQLSGYLCGTHSGLLSPVRRGERGPEALALAHRALGAQAVSAPDSELGPRMWTLADSKIADRLRTALDHPAVIELILFGSQSRGSVTGFSDVDAILVINDEAAENPKVLRSVRPRVLSAERAVLAYQPMQHHGFEVATPKLLQTASEALALPATALADTSSLYGRTVRATLSNGSERGREPLMALIRSLVSVPSWPGHVWKAHRLIAMFELLPVLYLQCRGESVPKWQSFDEVRNEFPDSWWPYDVLNEVRLAWPRTRRRRVELAAALARNPWVAVAAWRRLPARVPEQVRPLLTHRVLEGLRKLARAMAHQA